MKGGLVSLSLTAIQSAIQFLTIVVIAKYFTAELLGVYTFINTLLLVTGIVCSFGMRQSYLLNKDTYRLKTYLYARLLLSFPYCAFALIYYCFVFDSVTLLYVSIFFYRLVTFFTEILWSHFISCHSYKKLMLSQGVKSTLCFLVFLYSAHSGMSIERCFFYQVLTVAFLFVIFDSKVMYLSIAGTHSKLSEVKACIINSAPYFVGQSSIAFQNNSPRLILGFLSSSTALGLFSVAHQLYNVIFFAFSSMLNFYLKKRVGRKSILLPTFIVFLFCLALNIVWWLFGREFLKMFLSEEYLVIFYPTQFIFGFLFFKLCGYLIYWRMLSQGFIFKVVSHQVILAACTSLIAVIFIYVIPKSGVYFSIVVSFVFYFFYMLFLDRKINTQK
ncbi:hypothetical protein BK026_02250 [Alteromonas sp. V450]|uniref:lipopolysaccharide biosynthesis protein n=1 Tax=Alteromonas sp. V450 TaxID=1912139 RepID=UPI0008FF0BD7|nr:oligosaccharide flippase family protein [Alteromonas sp. V450]OJF67700.1 hypothetical protein BK026_02250 [Alteromonas sp. V450]